MVGEFLRHPLRLALVPVLFRLLDEREHVSHVQDAAGHAVGVEQLKVVQGFARGGEHDGLAGDGSHGKCGTTAGVAVELGQDHTGEVHAFVERLGRVDGVLADHGVDDEQDFVGVDGGADVRRLLHQFSVNAEASGGVDNDHVVQLGLGFGEPGQGHCHGIASGAFKFAADTGVRGENWNAGALTVDLQLLDSIGALQISGHQERAVPLTLEPLGKLAGEGGFTGTLQTSQHDHGGWVFRQIDAAGFPTKDGNQFLIDNLDDLLRRVQRLIDLGAECAFTNLGGEFTDHGHGNVGIQEGATNLTHGGIDVGLAEPTLATEVLEGGCQPIR